MYGRPFGPYGLSPLVSVDMGVAEDSQMTMPIVSKPVQAQRRKRKDLTTGIDAGLTLEVGQAIQRKEIFSSGCKRGFISSGAGERTRAWIRTIRTS